MPGGLEGKPGGKVLVLDGGVALVRAGIAALLVVEDNPGGGV